MLKLLKSAVPTALILFSLLSFSTNGANAQDAEYAFWPDVTYKEEIPTLEDVVGHKTGERITSPEATVRYLRALEQAAPTQVKVFEYARSWQGRPLVYAAIGSPENIAALDGLKDGMAALYDPRKTDAARADELINTLPATVWLAYSVHGNEISPTDAGLLTAYHLLAAENDELVQKILADAVVFIDPLQNPDGRNRFIQSFESTLGLEASGSVIAAERREPWPGGRINHYLFDMNRDWFTLSQPETVGRIKYLREWRPLIFVDAHEMGTDTTYYFAPATDPFNPHLTGTQLGNIEIVGRNNARWFDRFGIDYFTRDIFDGLYPGYGDTWPAFYGAAAMTYEQASARGLKARRTDGSEFDYRDTVRQQFITSLSTAEAGAANREKLLRDFWEYQQSAVDEGRKENVRTYILPATEDRKSADALAAQLVAQGVEVKTATDDFTACAVAYKRGAHIIPLAQPAKRLIRTLMDADSPMEEDFLAEQERLREKDLSDELYDVTAWSLPQAHNVDVDTCDVGLGEPGRIGGDAFKEFAGAEPGALLGPANAVAYVVDWDGPDATRFLANALRAGIVVKTSKEAFTLSGRRFGRGALIIRAADNPATVRATLGELARTTGAVVYAAPTSWVEDGPSFGGRMVSEIKPPKIAIAWDTPVNPLSAGATRYVLERRFGYPATPVRVQHLDEKGLDQFDVLILPDSGGYGAELGPAKEKITEWVSRGGTLIGFDRAMRWLSDPEANLLSTRRENAYREKPAEEKEDAAKVDGVILKTAEEARAAITPASEAPDATSGVLARAAIDPDHWLSAGAKPTVHALLRGGDIYTPLTLDQGINVVRFEGPDNLLAGGYLWKETREQFAYKPFMVVESKGDGHIIGFTQDPTHRAQFPGLDVLVANAVFRGAAASRKLR